MHFLKQAPPSSARRAVFVDELRGFCIILIVFYHFIYDVNWLTPYSIHHPLIDFAGAASAAVMIFIAGIASLYSRNNLKRGLLCFGLGMVLTLVTSVVMPDCFIWFGILHLLGLCMILFALGKRWLLKIPAWLGLVVCFVLFLLTFDLTKGYLGIQGFCAVQVYDGFVESPFLFPLGFITKTFSSSDYFPLMPWFFLYLSGAYLGTYIRADRAPSFVYHKHLPLLSIIGKKTMLIYLIHQPLFYFFFWLSFSIIPSLGT